MNELMKFIRSNVYGTCGEMERGPHSIFKDGIVDLYVLPSIAPVTEVDVCRLSYIRNLCLINPVSFFIPSEVNGLERACMKLSFGEYEDIDLSMYSFRHELIGTVLTIDGAYQASVLLVRCSGTKNKKQYCYSTEKYCFDDVKVESLTVEEQSILLVEMVRILKTEICQDLRRLKAQAYIDRLLFPENETSEFLRRTVMYYHLMVNLEPVKLDIGNGDIPDSVFTVPFVFLSDIEKQLAEVFYVCGSSERALEYFRKYNNTIKTIQCLINLNRKEEAMKEATEEIRRIGTPVSHESRTKLCNLNISLGNITGEESYFDCAFNVYRSYEPLKAKAVYFIREKHFDRAVECLKAALELAPRNVELLFLYASALTSCERFAEAAVVYEKLVADDQKNVVFLRNLAMCRIRVEDVENGLRALKEASRYDQHVMQAYFLMSIKYNIRKEILYSLERLDKFEDFEEGVMYLVDSGTLGKDEVKAALMKNNRIANQISFLLDRIDRLKP